jgi:hypothetical protein
METAMAACVVLLAASLAAVCITLALVVRRLALGNMDIRERDQVSVITERRSRPAAPKATNLDPIIEEENFHRTQKPLWERMPTPKDE